MKFVIHKNPVITLLAHFTGKPPDEFRLNGFMPEFRTSKKPEIWKCFYLPVNTIVAWYNFNQGFAAPYEIEIDPDNLYFTDWKKGGRTFSIKDHK